MDNSKEKIYCQLLGALFANFQGLEFAVRAYLHDKSDPSEIRMSKDDDLNRLRVDDRRTVNSMTSSKSLRPLVKRYNELVPPESLIDESIIDIRDALAHGRVFNRDAEGWFHLLKFSQEQDENGKVTVTFSQQLSPDWLQLQIRRVSQCTHKVLAVQNQRNDDNSAA